INNLFNKPVIKDVVYGYQVAEEAAFLHEFYYGCQLTDPLTGNPGYVSCEIPVSNLTNAFSYFKGELQSAGIEDDKLILMEANHGLPINEVSNDWEVDVNGISFQNQPIDYNPQEYLKTLKL